MKLNQPSDQHLEPIAPANLRCFQSKLQSLWKQCICFISNNLIPINEPIIEKRIDRNGVERWHIYDPATDQKITLESVKEVLIWLDDRYNCNKKSGW